jgi:hypothetical protein
MSWGFVYIMDCTPHEGMFKVGYTTGSPFKRAEELSRSTSVPMPFTVICYAEFENVESHERRIHALLSDRRVSDRREFFYGPFSRIYNAVMDRGYAVALCEHHAAVPRWEEEHPALASFVGI